MSDTLKPVKHCGCCEHNQASAQDLLCDLVRLADEITRLRAAEDGYRNALHAAAERAGKEGV